MRTIKTEDISAAVEKAFLKAVTVLPDSMCALLCDAEKSESDARAKRILNMTCENARIAKENGVPICQDTGLPVVFLEIGQDVHIVGGTLDDAVNDGVKRAYVGGKFRLSAVDDPLYERKNTGFGGPAVIHERIVAGGGFSVTAVPKGFGSENKSAIKMFTPAASEDDIVEFVKELMLKAGGAPCPPTVIGIGIGGDFEYCAYLAKLALSRDVSLANADERYAKLEKKILDAVNATGIGAQGLGGDTSALAVKIITAPTHIAGLPVAVNVSCHASRKATVTI